MKDVERSTSATVEDVWAVLSDGWRYAGWVVGACRIRAVDPRWPAPGSKLHHSVGVFPLVLSDSTSVVDADPPHQLTLRARGWPLGEATVQVVLTPDASGGTRILMREDASEGPGRLVPGPLRHALIGLRNAEALRRLIYLAEGLARSRSSEGGVLG